MEGSGPQRPSQGAPLSPTPRCLSPCSIPIGLRGKRLFDRIAKPLEPRGQDSGKAFPQFVIKAEDPIARRFELDASSSSVIWRKRRRRSSTLLMVALAAGVALASLGAALAVMAS